MTRKRRGKIDEDLIITQAPLVSGGDDYDQCVKLFLDDLEIRNLAYHTRRWHKENLHCVKLAFERLNLALEPIKISQEHIKKCILYSLLYWKKDCSHSPTTINHRIRSLKQLFIFLVSEGIVNTNPAINLEKLKTPKVVIRPFSEKQIKRLLEQPNKSTFVGFRDYTIMLVLLDTGVRLIELLNMRTSDVILTENKIIVFGKGSKEREVVFQSTTKESLRKYLLVRGQLDHDYLWISQDSKPIQRKSIQDRLKLYGRNAEITDVRVSPHTFRHTCARLYLLTI